MNRLSTLQAVPYHSHHAVSAGSQSFVKLMARDKLHTQGDSEEESLSTVMLIIKHDVGSADINPEAPSRLLLLHILRCLGVRLTSPVV